MSDGETVSEKVSEIVPVRTSSLMNETLVKIMLLGDSGVGKSQLFNLLKAAKFNLNPSPTAGIDFSTLKIKIDTRTVVKAQIVDTSGLERFQSVTRQYWSLVHGACVVFDLSNRQSFENAKKLVKEFKTKFYSSTTTKPDPIIMLLGNKSDIPERKVDAEEAQAYAVDQEFLYMETSALNSSNVMMAFNILITEVYHIVTTFKRDQPSPEIGSWMSWTAPSPVLTPQPTPAKKSHRNTMDFSLLTQARNLYDSLVNVSPIEEKMPEVDIIPDILVTKEHEKSSTLDDVEILTSTPIARSLSVSTSKGLGISMSQEMKKMDISRSRTISSNRRSRYV